MKVLASGEREPRKVASGPTMTARQMVSAVKRLTAGWSYDVVSIGYPAPVAHGKPIAEPKNLGTGWVGFDFAKAFGKPVRLINDAAMQALGSYRGGRMLFLGLGTGLGSALIVDGSIVPMEIAHLPYKRGKSYEHYLGARGLRRLGKKRWQKEVREVVARFRRALEVDYTVLGGGNARLVEKPPPQTLLGSNANAFLGGFQLWRDSARRRGAGRS